MTCTLIPGGSLIASRTVIYSTFLMLAVSGSSSQAQGLDQETVRFVSDVVCRNEFKGEGAMRCSRWTKPPTLSTFGSESHHPTVIANIVKQLNESLPEANRIQLLESHQADATIKVFFVSLAEFPKIAKENNCTYVDGNWGFFNISWNRKYEIQNSVILIAHDRLRGNRLHHTTLEEITQSLGMAGDSKRFEDSIFYEDQSQGEFGTTTRLSELDKKAIRFLYQYVEPGSYPIEVGIQMAKHWNGK